jgi:hypothetical protein
VCIVHVFGVFVKYLVTGHEAKRNKSISSLDPELQSILNSAEEFNRKNKKLALALINTLKEQEDKK